MTKDEQDRVDELEASRRILSREIRRIKQAANNRTWRAKIALAKAEKGE